MGHVFFRRLASAVVASTALSAAATDWYVGSGAGASDSNDGMNAAQPLASLDKAIVRATANDTIYVLRRTLRQDRACPVRRMA